MIERVLGPVNGGYFVAAYAYAPETEPREFLAFFKLFTEEPDSPWAAGCILKGRCEAANGDETAALEAAVRLGEQTAANLPPASACTEYRISGLTDLGT